MTTQDWINEQKIEAVQDRKDGKEYWKTDNLYTESDLIEMLEAFALYNVSKSTIKHKIQQGMADCGWVVIRSFKENESWETAIEHLVKYLEKKGINVGK